MPDEQPLDIDEWAVVRLDVDGEPGEFGKELGGPLGVVLDLVELGAFRAVPPAEAGAHRSNPMH
jgi:hypothetical protein